MRKVILIQHEAYEVRGTLDPLLKGQGLRIRYVNFERYPEANPTLDRYDGLILMGGYMGVYEAEKYEHIKVEMRLIEEALKRGMPILGICLGSQLVAHVLGADVRKHVEREMGWYDIHLTEEGKADPVLGHFGAVERVFQSHGDTFEIPEGAVHLAWSEGCRGQAYRYGDRVYGLQFHLEVDRHIVSDWLEMPENREIFGASCGRFDPELIRGETERCLQRSMDLSVETFTRFLRISGVSEKRFRFRSGHGE
jgi:GMP synthase (glutamine-hydrolysing)